jgi:hypothetical protein
MSSEIETSLAVICVPADNNERFLDSARNDIGFQQSQMGSRHIHSANKLVSFRFTASTRP